MGDAEKIARWLVVYLAVISGRGSDTIRLDERLVEFDLDSFDIVELTAAFEKAFGRAVEPEFFLRGETSLHDVVEKLAAAPTAP